MCANQKTTESYSEKNRSETEEYQGANSISDTENEERTIYTDLIGDVLAYDNIVRALKQVKSNKGAPGVDGMTVDELDTWLENDFQETAEKIRCGKYKLPPVRRFPNRTAE